MSLAPERSTEDETTEVIVDLREPAPMPEAAPDPVAPPPEAIEEVEPEPKRKDTPKVTAPVATEGYTLPPLDILKLSGAKGHDGFTLIRVLPT